MRGPRGGIETEQAPEEVDVLRDAERGIEIAPRPWGI
jgi:hypothetical protein